MVTDAPCTHDVAIIGGGPAGATAGTLLKKYAPDLHVVILEKATFPRDHVGESQLPLISLILEEMGCWDAVEAAGFPVKIGAGYVWGRDPEPWYFNFIPPEQFTEADRPARFEGVRRYTAFQVERARYDEILLRHAERMGCDVREATPVAEVLADPDADRIEGLRLGGAHDGETITARHYLDASGASGLLRRAVGVGVRSPEVLRNVAFWDYWEDATWAEEIGTGGTRVQIRTIPWGWLWFIPVAPTKVSIGLVCHADHYKASGTAPEDLYREAIEAEPAIRGWVADATPRGRVESTRDWSYVADRLAGANWMLTGDAAGFADPILSAGMTLAQNGARDAAYTMLELDRGEHDAAWLRRRYDGANRDSIDHHIRFAEYWYSANGLQTELHDYCAEIAKKAGLRLRPRDAFRWLSQGAFASELGGSPTIGLFDLTSIHDITRKFGGETGRSTWTVEGNSRFDLNLHNATEDQVGDLKDGRITAVPCYTKGDKRLPHFEFYGVCIDILRQTNDAQRFVELAENAIGMLFPPEHHRVAYQKLLESLEAMAIDGWVRCSRDRKRPPLERGAAWPSVG